MKKINSLLAIMLILATFLSSCSIFDGLDDTDNGGAGNVDVGNGDSGNDTRIPASPLPENSFVSTERPGVIGSIIQLGDGTAYVNGNVPSPQRKSGISFFSQTKSENDNKHLVTLEHNFGNSCFVSGYIGNSLYVIQDFGSLAWNKKGVGHKDGSVILEYGENGYFSISSFSENKIIVGNPTDKSTESLWDDTQSYMFGYMVYNPNTRELLPMYEENNLRFYTAGYFINGVAIVSVKEGDKILFGIIDSNGNFVVEPKYEMMADESINDLVIVGINAELFDSEEALLTPYGNCGRFIRYDSTIMTNVQGTRYYKLKSQNVGIINTLTGESVLPCNYAFVERVKDNTYFVIDNEGAKFLYDAITDSFTAVESGIYSYFNSEWMLFVDENGNAYFADKEFKLYETAGLNLDVWVQTAVKNANDRVNTNIVSELRNQDAKALSKNAYTGTELHREYDFDNQVYTVTVTATGDIIHNVNTTTTPYNGGFLYTVENSLYRYDMEKGTSKKIETGYGDYTEDYENIGVRYFTSIGELDTGIYLLRYNIEYISDGSRSYHMIIINDMGEVLFDTSINSVETLCKNYLGKYDEALYSLAGSTQIEDNYFLTRDNGSHFLIQFVRGENSTIEDSDNSENDYTRTVDNTDTITLLSPFKLNFTDGSEISVTIDGEDIPSDYYVYDSNTQSFKIFSRAFYIHHKITEKMRENKFVDILVTSGNETITLRINVSPFAYRF